MLNKLLLVDRGILLATAAVIALGTAALLYAVMPSPNVPTCLTAALAIYAAFIATLGELRNAAAKGRSHRFDCILRVNGNEPRRAVLILRFTNTSERPATVDAIEVRAAGKIQNISVQFLADVGKGARKLGDGDFIVGEVDANHLSGALMGAGWKGVAQIRPVALLSDGSSWDAGEMDFDCDEWSTDLALP